MNLATNCNRCDNGWFVHPTQGWAVSCPNCRDGAADYWLPGLSGSEGRVVHRAHLPADHASQAVVPMPDYVRPALREAAARAEARRLALSASHDGGGEP